MRRKDLKRYAGIFRDMIVQYLSEKDFLDGQKYFRSETAK